MSYILDALRKAEAERERGHVPSVHAQPVLPHAAPSGAPRASRRGAWIGGAAALAVLLGAGFAWWLAGGGTPATTLATAAAPAATATPASTTPAPGVAPTSPAVPTAALPSPPAAPLASAPAVPTPPLPVPAAEPGARRPRPPLPAAEARLPLPARSPPAVTTSTGVPLPAPAPGRSSLPAQAQAPEPVAAGGDPSGPLAGKIYPLSELPDAIRSQLPPLSIGGSMYSPVRANRLLIVNGQIAHEGDAVAPGLVLEQVRVKAAVFVFRGYRYSLPF